MSEEEKNQLRRKLWDIANDLRGRMDPIEFKDYILCFIFYKHLSDRVTEAANSILENDDIKYTDLKDNDFIDDVIDSYKETLNYSLRPDELFSSFVKRKGEFIISDINAVFSSIENSTLGTESEDDFKRLFEDCNLDSSKLGDTPDEKNEVVFKIISQLSQIDFKLGKGDILGDAYEYLISQFAGSAGKKAGEFYTPHTVSEILSKIVCHDKELISSVYDPTCGSGSLLLSVANEVDNVSRYYGQEQNRTTYNLARMNMILHNIPCSKFKIKHGDTLESPRHDLDARYEGIVANPPFSANWSADPRHLDDPRFNSAGRLAPKSKADFAFIQHMVHHLSEDGVMTVVMPHGVLFRGAAEGHIRRYLIEDKNMVDAVIGLPANIFFGTSIPTCILVLKKCRTSPKDILFIDASAHFEKGKNQNNLRPEDIDKIIAAYGKREFEDKYSYVAPLDEIVENDYNLNIPRYVDTFEEEEAVDLDVVSTQLKQLEQDMKETDTTIADFCGQLGIKAPF